MTQFVLANQTPQDEVGRTLPKSRLYFYENNTFNFKDVYSDTARTSVLPNPVIADGDGRFPAIYLAVNSNYRVSLKDRFDKQVTPFVDNQGASAQGLGTAAYVNTGTGASDIPLNSDLGSAALGNLSSDSFVPVLDLNTHAGASITEGANAVYQFNYQILDGFVNADFQLFMDDNSVSAVVGDTFLFRSMPLLIRPISGVTGISNSTNVGQVTVGSPSTGNYAIFQMTAISSSNNFLLTCSYSVGSVDYGDSGRGFISWRA